MSIAMRIAVSQAAVGPYAPLATLALSDRRAHVSSVVIGTARESVYIVALSAVCYKYLQVRQLL